MKWIGRFINYLAAVTLTGMVIVAIGVATAWLYLDSQLPSTETLKDVRMQVPLRIYSAEGTLIAEYGEKRREPTERDEIPERMVQAFLAVEDSNFYHHPGVDYRGIARAVVSLVKSGQRRQGGSTITMQLARNFFLSPEKSYKRKIQEILLALRIERELEKDEILNLYLNKIYLGHRSYGVKAAAHTYYGVELNELSISETAMIAGLPKAPSSDNPLTNPKRAEARRNHVLDRMLTLDYISDEEHKAAVAESLSARHYTPDIQLEAAYVGEMVRKEMIERYGEDAYTGGYHVFTTVKPRLQRAANTALRGALDVYDERHGYRGAEAHLDNWQDAKVRKTYLDAPIKVGDLVAAIVVGFPSEKSVEVEVAGGVRHVIEWKGLKWASPYVTVNRRGKAPRAASDIVEPGDVVRLQWVTKESKSGVDEYWRLAQVPQAQGALVSLDPKNGAVVALTGGYDYYHSKFNRATQAFRQPGSGFKGFIYSSALAAGYQPSSIIVDAPVVIRDPTLPGGFWKPANANRKFSGPTPLRYGLAFSKNLISIRLLRSIGADFALDHIANFGFDTNRLPKGLALALGSGEVAPIEMARGYSVFANGGYLVDPYFIQQIDQIGEGTVYKARPSRICPDCKLQGVADIAKQSVTSENRFLMYSMMKDVIRMGTGKRALALGRKDLAGKTGTTNDYKDAWFNGYNESLVAVAWIGHDDSTTLGRYEEGGKTALPAWVSYMKVALDGVPETEPKQPEGVEMVGGDFMDVTVEMIYTPESMALTDEALDAEDTLF